MPGSAGYYSPTAKLPLSQIERNLKGGKRSIHTQILNFQCLPDEMFHSIPGSIREGMLFCGTLGASLHQCEN